MTKEQVNKARKLYAAAAPIMGGLLGRTNVLELDPKNVPADRQKAGILLTNVSAISIAAAKALEKGIYFEIDPEGAKKKFSPPTKEEVTEE